MVPRLEREFQLPNTEHENSFFLSAFISVLSGDTVVPALHLEPSTPPFAAATSPPCARCGANGCVGCESAVAASVAVTGSSSEGEECSAASCVKDGGVRKRRARKGGKFRGVGQVGGGDPRPAPRRPQVARHLRHRADAARAYDVAALEFRGHRAKLNFPVATASSTASASSWTAAQPQRLSDRHRENCGSNASSPAHVPRLPEQGRPVAREQDIWDGLHEIMMMDGCTF